MTFLATLFLLLLVSCAIVLRSYILRRRYQRQIENALALGIVLTPRAPGSKRKRFGVRPHMYESWIAPLHVSGLSGTRVAIGEEVDETSEKRAGGRWCDMLVSNTALFLSPNNPSSNYQYHIMDSRSQCRRSSSSAAHEIPRLPFPLTLLLLLRARRMSNS